MLAESPPVFTHAGELGHGTATRHGLILARRRAARAGMAAILAASRCSHTIPGGRLVRRQVITSSPATIRSRRKSCGVSGSTSARICSGYSSVAVLPDRPVQSDKVDRLIPLAT
jgi:hypothetical protein